MTFSFKAEKNEILIRERGISFQDAIEAISEKGILLEIEHPNPSKYPNQKLLVIDLNGYPHCVPIEINGPVIEMKTVFPDRRFKYLLEE